MYIALFCVPNFVVERLNVTTECEVFVLPLYCQYVSTDGSEWVLPVTWLGLRHTLVRAWRAEQSSY